jgi:hypothetical protein
MDPMRSDFNNQCCRGLGSLLGLPILWLELKPVCLDYCRQSKVKELLKALARPALHAQTLGFVHPMTREVLHFSSELPADFAATLAELRMLQ